MSEREDRDLDGAEMDLLKKSGSFPAHDPKRDPIGHRVASEGVQIGSLDVFEDEARPFFVAHHLMSSSCHNTNAVNWSAPMCP